MKAYIYLIILISIVCKYIHRPKKTTLKYLKQKLGKEQVKSLYGSFRKNIIKVMTRRILLYL